MTKTELKNALLVGLLAPAMMVIMAVCNLLLILDKAIQWYSDTLAETDGDEQ